MSAIGGNGSPTWLDGYIEEDCEYEEDKRYNPHDFAPYRPDAECPFCWDEGTDSYLDGRLLLDEAEEHLVKEGDCMVHVHHRCVTQMKAQEVLVGAKYYPLSDVLRTLLDRIAKMSDDSDDRKTLKEFFLTKIVSEGGSSITVFLKIYPPSELMTFIARAYQSTVTKNEELKMPPPEDQAVFNGLMDSLTL